MRSQVFIRAHSASINHETLRPESPTAAAATEVQNLAPSHEDILKFYSRTVVSHCWKLAERKRHSCDSNTATCGCRSVEQYDCITAALCLPTSYSRPTFVKYVMFTKTTSKRFLNEGSTKPKRRVARVIKVCTVASSICAFSVWNCFVSPF